MVPSTAAITPQSTEGAFHTLRSLDDPLSALGSTGVMARYDAEVSLTEVVGWTGRSPEYDRDFNYRAERRDHRRMTWRARFDRADPVCDYHINSDQRGHETVEGEAKYNAR